MPKEHRILKIGNSSGITLASDELSHLNLELGDLVYVNKRPNGTLIIRRDWPTVKRKKPAR